MKKASTWLKLFLVVVLVCLLVLGPAAFALYKNLSGPLWVVVIAVTGTIGWAIVKPLVNYIVRSDE